MLPERVTKKLEALWGYPEFLKYMVDLTSDTRGGREGWPLEDFRALVAYDKAHRVRYPDLYVESTVEYIIYLANLRT